MTSNFEKVRDFSRKFEIVDEWRRDPEPHLIDDGYFLFRSQLIMEELTELCQAHREGDVVKFADALGDLLYVVYGLADICSMPMDEIFAEIHRANMTKVRSNGKADPRGKRSSEMDVVKPEGFKPPDVARVLRVVTDG